MFHIIDIHGYTVSEAKVYLDNYINSLPDKEFEITIIHGYHSDILLRFIRQQYKHKRVKRRIITMNRGETIFLISN